MSFLIGEYACKLDAKGRLAIPKRVKASLPEVLTDGLYIRRGLDSYLAVYTSFEYNKILKNINSLNDMDSQQRNLKRALLKRDCPIEIDKAGRILLTKAMIEHAQLDHEVKIVGMYTHFEIWNPEIEEKMEQSESDNIKKLEQRIFGVNG